MLAMQNIQIEDNTTNYSIEELQDIINHVNSILTTIKGTVPLARGDGMDGSIIDLPMDIAKSRYTVEVIKKIRQYEKRISVEEIIFTYNEKDNVLNPKVVIANAE